MAFQLQDDVLDYTGDSEALGKNIGDDLTEGKATLPLIYTIANGSSEHSDLVRRSISEKDTGQIKQVVNAVQESGGLAYTRQMAENEVELAKAQLTSLPDNNYTQTLRELADFSLGRSF
jgi:octaprenyl-diphosphate synthase